MDAVTTVTIQEVRRALWRAVKSHAATDGLTVREVFQRLMTAYVTGRITLVDSPKKRDSA